MSKSLAARQKTNVFFPGVPARVLRLVNPLFNKQLVSDVAPTITRVFPAQLGATMTEWIWAVACVTELVVTLQNAFENTIHHI